MNNDKWPSVDVAFELVEPSYNWALNRLDATEKRIHGLQSLSATLTAAVPIAAEAVFESVTYANGWFIAALAAFGLLMVAGLITRFLGDVYLPDFDNFLEKRLDNSPWEFKKDALHDAACHIEHNLTLVNRKWKAYGIMGFLLTIEVVCLCVWLVSA